MEKIKFSIFLLITFVFSSGLSAQSVKILLMGDSQKIVNEDPNGFLSTMGKLLTDSNTKDADFILEMGDITEDSFSSNWDVAQTGWRKLDGKIPYVLNVGNNDLMGDASANKFNEHFPLSHYSAWPSFVSNYNRHSNVAHCFNAGGVNWLVISVKHNSNTAEMNWAENLIQSNPDKKVIFVSHDAHSTSSETAMCKKYGNVVFVFSGHSGDAHMLLNGNKGNKIGWVKTCHHSASRDSYFCYLEIDVKTGMAKFRYYSPQYGKFWDDPMAPHHSSQPKDAPWTWSGFEFAPVVDEGNTYQAENATLSGAIVNNDQTDYNGTGFVGFVNASGDYLQWTVNVPSAGSYDLGFRYALPNGERPLELKVNGSVMVASFEFPGTSLWTNWQTVSTKQFLNAGNNTIRLTSIGSYGGNYDELTINNGTTSINDFKSGIEVKSFTVYPNPFINGILSIKLVGFEHVNNVRVRIINITGKVVFEELLFDTAHLELKLPGKLNESVYFISVESSDTKIVNKLVVG